MPPFNATSFRQSNWAERSGFWAAQTNAKKPRFRGDPARPLVLSGHGVRLNIDHGAFFVRHGLTHYPQKAEERFFFPGDLDLPSRIILVGGNGSISFDVLSWLAEQNIPFIRINWKGEIICLAGASGYAANPERVRWQIETRDNAKSRMDFCSSIITKKIEASILTLERSIRHSEKQEIAIEYAYAALTRLDEKLPRTINEVRGLEANCAAAYFRSWVGIAIKWRRGSRRPIPGDWRAIVKRSSPFYSSGNFSASHPVNAILNYAYTVLESEIRIKTISDGYDPTVGIMHEGRSGASKFVFDLIEPERPKVDRKILDFVRSSTFDPADFVIRSDGVCRLNPEMARCIAAMVAA